MSLLIPLKRRQRVLRWRDRALRLPICSKTMSEGPLRMATGVRQLKVWDLHWLWGFWCRGEVSFMWSFFSCSPGNTTFSQHSSASNSPEKQDWKEGRKTVEDSKFWFCETAEPFKEQMCHLETAFSVSWSTYFSYSAFFKKKINKKYGILSFLYFPAYGLIIEIGVQSCLSPALHPSQLNFVLLHNFLFYHCSISARPDPKLMIPSFLNPNQGREVENMIFVEKHWHQSTSQHLRPGPWSGLY